MKKISDLTPEQVARFPEFVAKWKSIGLCCDPIDRNRARNAINLAYSCAGLDAPKHVIYCGSPLSLRLTRSILKEGRSVCDSVCDSVWASVLGGVWASVHRSVEASVRASVLGSVRASVLGSVWDSAWDSVADGVLGSVWDSGRDSVEASVRDSVLASVWDSVRDSVWDNVHGQHEAGWLSYYDYFQIAVGLKLEKIAGLIECAKTIGWFVPFKDVCLVSERTSSVALNDGGAIHCENGPAISYPDGFEVYGWNGIVVPREWIMEKEKLTATMALTEENMERRRAACEIVGWHRILSELNTRTIDVDADPEIGELIEVQLPDIGKERFLRVRCGTGRTFALPVPPNMKTALQANAWTYDIDGDLLKQKEHRT